MANEWADADERAIIEACDAIRAVKYHPLTTAYGETVRAILRALVGQQAAATEPKALRRWTVHKGGMVESAIGEWVWFDDLAADQKGESDV
jgi:hypothetical protein